MKKSMLFDFILALVASLLVTVPAQAVDFSTAELDFWYILSATGSSDPAYSAAFGATSIVGRLNGAFRFNGTLYDDAKFVNLKFYQPWVVLDPNVSACVQKALTVGAAQLQLGPSPDRNAQLVIKVTGDVRLNGGNGDPGGGALTILEVRSLRSIACEAQFNFPDWP